MRHIVPVIVILACSCAAPAQAESQKGQYAYGTEAACVSAGKFSPEQCANAAANAQAEFDEKAPRFATREACEKLFGGGRCSLGFSGADGWAGKRSAIHFTPRFEGYQINVDATGKAAVLPATSQQAIAFRPRPIHKRDALISPAVAHRARTQWRAQTGPAAPPAGAALPPPPPIDPNFDCTAVLEPGVKGDDGTGCYPAPRSRR